MNWEDNAICKGVDPRVFYPDLGDSLVQARAICAACPVQAACLEANLWDDYGIFAGTTRHQREQLRTGRQRPSKLARWCPRGHGYTEENTAHDPDGHRRCITCRKIENARRWVRSA